MVDKIITEIEQIILEDSYEIDTEEEMINYIREEYNLSSVEDKVIEDLIWKAKDRLRCKDKFGINSCSSKDSEDSGFIVDPLDETGVNMYGENWSKISEKIRDKYDNICVSCNKTSENKLSVHHIIPRREFLDNFTNRDLERLDNGMASDELEEEFLERMSDANKESNLVPLCNSCHQSIENLDLEEQISEFSYEGDQITMLNPQN